MGEVSRVIDCHIDAVCSGVEHHRGHRTQGLVGQGCSLGYRVLGNALQLLFLMNDFEVAPVIPDLAQALAVNGLELAVEQSLAVFGAVIEGQELVQAVLILQVVYEAGTVEIGVGAHLKIRSGAFRFEAND